MNTIYFPRWAEVIGQDAELSENDKTYFPITIRWYLSFLKQHNQLATIDSARAFIDFAAREKTPKPWVRKKWETAINWFFRNGRKVKKHLRVPVEFPESNRSWGALPLELSTLPPWEQRTIALIRRRNMSYQTEKSYMGWLKRFEAHFRSDMTMIKDEAIIAFLNHLAVESNVSASTQRQALNALVFFVREVEGHNIGDISEFVRAHTRKRLPTVLTQSEIKQLFASMKGQYATMAKLQYGTGLRRNELITLRIKDIDFERKQLCVRYGKGGKDRIVSLPQSVVQELKTQIDHCRTVFDQDRKANAPGVFLPRALEKKYPNHGKRWEWFWLWPANKESTDPRTQLFRRHHTLPDYYQRELHQAASLSDIAKPVNSHIMRHSFATHLLESGENIRTVQELLGHKSIETTQIYLHVLSDRSSKITSPLDRIN